MKVMSSSVLHLIDVTCMHFDGYNYVMALMNCVDLQARTESWSLGPIAQTQASVQEQV